MGTAFAKGTVRGATDKDGALYAVWGDPPTQAQYIGDGFEPFAHIEIGRVWPDPNNDYYNLIWFTGDKAGGGTRTYRNWGNGAVGAWYGPFDAVP